MRQLMRQQALSALRSRIVLARRKHHVTAEREGERLNAGCRSGGLWSVMTAHVAKVMAEARLEVAAAVRIEWCPGAQAAREVGSDLVAAARAMRQALDPRRLFVIRARGGCVCATRALPLHLGTGHAHHLIGD